VWNQQLEFTDLEAPITGGFQRWKNKDTKQIIAENQLQKIQVF
jgi:hypothetical protein